MSELISGKEALIALANGEEVEYTNSCTPSWHELSVSGISINEIVNPKFNKFRLKPRTITLNNIEVPAPFEPKHGDEIWFLNPDYGCGYADGDYDPAESVIQFGAWRSEDEIKQVVSALRSVFKDGV